MTVEMECVAFFKIEPPSKNGPEIGPWFTATIYIRVLDSAFGKFEIMKNYSTRSYEQFAKDWGYVEEVQLMAAAIQSGLYQEEIRLQVDLTERGLRVDERRFF